jgi:hypothetical protein
MKGPETIIFDAHDKMALLSAPDYNKEHFASSGYPVPPNHA